MWQYGFTAGTCCALVAELKFIPFSRFILSEIFVDPSLGDNAHIFEGLSTRFALSHVRRSKHDFPERGDAMSRSCRRFGRLEMHQHGQWPRNRGS